MKMQKVPLAEGLLGKESISKFDTPIVSDFDNEVQAFRRSVKTLAEATMQGGAA